LFSGISIFSDAKFDEKVQYKNVYIIVLFDIFDFDEMDVLPPIDVEFMLYCCISAAYKIFNITNEIGSGGLTTFINNKFINCNKITVADLIK
jgi:hypothetical protein